MKAYKDFHLLHSLKTCDISVSWFAARGSQEVKHFTDDVDIGEPKV